MQKMTFTLTDVIKIVVLVAGGVALYFQVNGRLDNLDSQMAAMRGQQEQLRVEVGIVRAQTKDPDASNGRSRSGTRSNTD